MGRPGVEPGSFRLKGGCITVLPTTLMAIALQKLVHRAGVEPASNTLIGRGRPPLPPPVQARNFGVYSATRCKPQTLHWSGWLDSNQRLLVPKTSRLTTDLHPDD